MCDTKQPHDACVQLVLINIGDHYTRTRVNTAPAPGGDDVTVLGCLLGQQTGRSVDISNSYEMKFERSADGSAVIDHAFLLKKQDQCEMKVIL